MIFSVFTFCVPIFPSVIGVLTVILLRYIFFVKSLLQQGSVLKKDFERLLSS